MQGERRLNLAGCVHEPQAFSEPEVWRGKGNKPVLNTYLLARCSRRSKALVPLGSQQSQGCAQGEVYPLGRV